MKTDEILALIYGAVVVVYLIWFFVWISRIDKEESKWSVHFQYPHSRRPSTNNLMVDDPPDSKEA